MLKDAYQTTACRGYDLKKILHELRRASIEGSLRYVEDLDIELPNEVGSHRDVFVVTEQASNVPPFAHPIIFSLDDSGPSTELNSVIIAIDIRPFASRGRSGEFKVNAKGDFDFLSLRAGLMNYWMVDGERDLAALGSFPITVYSRWVADAISRRMALDPETQMKLTILSGFFYLCQFKDLTDVDENEKLKMAGQVARAVNISADTCISVLENVQPLADLAAFTAAAREVTGNVRLDKLNTGLVVAVTATGWFGANAQEIMAVALEHPPTFLSLVYAGLNHRGYHRAMFAKNVQQLDRRGVGKDFTYNLSRLPSL